MQRDAGAPVVLRGVLWGVVSSWRAAGCGAGGDGGASFVNLVAAPDISAWLDAVTRDFHWKLREINFDDDNFI